MMGREEPQFKQPNSKNEGVTGVYDTADVFDESFQRFITDGETKIYDRYSYPELVEKERELKRAIGLEDGEVLLYSSGMTAINEALFASLRPHSVLLYDPNTYLQTPELVKDYERRGVTCVSVNMGNRGDVAQAIQRHKPTVILGEVVSNSPDGMHVIDVESLVSEIEKSNKRYERELRLRDILRRRLDRIKEFGIKSLPDADREKIAVLFEEAAENIASLKSYMPLRKLLHTLKNEYGIRIGADDRASLLELKTIIDSAWAHKRDNPITLILDNTLPTEASGNLVEQVQSAGFPFLVAESGTKFFAQDKANLGIVYGSDKNTRLPMKLRRARTGGVLSPAAQKLVPDISREALERGKLNLENTKILAETLNRLVGTMGIKAVSHPNLPGHEHYDYASEKYPLGASPVLYVNCENAYETAKAIQHMLEGAGLEGHVRYSVSFAFDNIRLFFASKSDTVLRIAGGRETPEEMLAITETLLSSGKIM